MEPDDDEGLAIGGTEERRRALDLQIDATVLMLVEDLYYDTQDIAEGLLQAVAILRGKPKPG